MRTRLRVVGAVGLLLALGAAATLTGQQTRDEVGVPGYFQYSTAELREFETSLKSRMNQYKQAAEQLGDFGNHTAWIAHREADGLAEIHQDWTDLVFVQSGEAELRIGGVIDQPYAESPGEIRGSGVWGGVVRTLRPGDVVNVPAGTQHQFLVKPGGQVTFFTMKIRRP